jgi:chromosome segregation ATPase
MPRKKAPAAPEPLERNWGVLLEEMRAQIGALAEGMQAGFRRLEARIDESDATHERRFEVLEAVVRQNSADVRHNSADIKDLKAAVQQNSVDIRQNSADINDLKAAVQQNSVDIRQNSTDIRTLATRVEKVERIEERVTTLEQRRPPTSARR